MTLATKAFGSLLQRATQVCSVLVTGIVGNNNAILWTSVPEGVIGDSTTLHIIDPGGTNALAITVTGTTIDISLGTSGGAIITTALVLIAAIKAHSEAAALVTPANYLTSTGAGLVAAVAETPLAAGSDTTTYTTIAEVRTISGPSIKLNTVETTHLTSTAGYKTFIATLKEFAEFTCGLNFLPTAITQNYVLGLIKDARHGILRSFKIIFTDSASTTWPFSAFVTAVDVTGIDPDGAVQANASLRPSGQPTLV